MIWNTKRDIIEKKSSHKVKESFDISWKSLIEWKSSCEGLWGLWGQEPLLLGNVHTYACFLAVEASMKRKTLLLCLICYLGHATKRQPEILFKSKGCNH